MAALTYFAPTCIRHGNSTLTPGTLELSSLTRDLQQILDHFEVSQAGMGRRRLAAVSRYVNAHPRAERCLVKASMAIYWGCFFCCRACQISRATRFDHSIPLSCCQGSVGWAMALGAFWLCSTLLNIPSMQPKGWETRGKAVKCVILCKAGTRLALLCQNPVRLPSCHPLLCVKVQ